MNKGFVFSSSDESDDDEHLCPICYGAMDETDLRLFPCPCNFQVMDNQFNFNSRYVSGVSTNWQMIKNHAQTAACFIIKKITELLVLNHRTSCSRLLMCREDSEYDDSLSSDSDSCDTDCDEEKYHKSHLTKSQSKSNGDASEFDLSTIPPEILRIKMLRIIQRNLVYLVGFPAEDMHEEFLRSQTMFGQYGNMLKVVMSKHEQPAHQNQSAVL